ncbi:hypothetical protein [Paenibacillus ginsengarvi]|uniref:FAD-dependent oxidoreductase n=1 Tax=Paenibacillus ginsengarvi TaxID=400777 RepID=A0A3B0CMW0_9BACL|nr:hypothetical protein [Paenibacillus ginsengarvi]RKN85296.1 hypothetical protein D7M11_09425 [Paenibacillus ginsengarvi]
MKSSMDVKERSGLPQIETVPVLVIGATLAGLGLAAAGKERALVVERTSGVGREYLGCFHPGERLEEPTSSEAAGVLREELTRRNLLSENRLHLGALAPVLFNRIRRDGWRVRFLTEIIGIEREAEADAYTVTLFDASGLRQIRTSFIVDTTSLCVSSPASKPAIRSKKLNAMLHNADPSANAPVLNEGGAEVVQGRFPGEVILKLNLDPGDDWPSARDKLHRYWADRPAAFGSWTMALVADAFETFTEKGPFSLGDRWVWLPSCAYANALQAFDAGTVFDGGGIFA